MLNMVEIGDTVILSNIKTDKLESFSIIKIHFKQKIIGTDLSKYDNSWIPVIQQIPMEELDISKGEISHLCPIAQKLLGCELNSLLKLPDENGDVATYKILKIYKKTHEENIK